MCKLTKALDPLQGCRFSFSECILTHGTVCVNTINVINQLLMGHILQRRHLESDNQPCVNENCGASVESFTLANVAT